MNETSIGTRFFNSFDAFCRVTRVFLSPRKRRCFALQFRGKNISANPSSFLVEPVLVVDPLFYPEMVLDKCPKAGCHVTVKRKGWKPFRMVYGLDHNIKVVSLQYICAEHGFYSPSADTYWEECMSWEKGEFLPICTSQSY